MLNIKKLIKEEIQTSKSFETFAGKRFKGAKKITDSAKEKGGPAMLTYHHFRVKLPYYENAMNGKFDIDDSKTEFKKKLDKLCELSENVEINQVEFQKLVGIIEVLGELIIKSK